MMGSSCHGGRVPRLARRAVGRLAGLALLALMVGPGTAAAETHVRVGGYSFPPFVDESAPQGGVTPALIAALNTLDSGVHFTFVETSPARRYRDFAAGRFDMMFLEMAAWDWHDRDLAITETRTFLRGGEVYVARSEVAQSESYFDDIESRSIAAFAGYHYGFADFESDASYLRSNFDIELSNKHRSNLGKLLRGRVEIAVVTKSFLELYLKENPAVAEKLRVSKRLDQDYNLGALVGPEAPIDAARLESLVSRLEDQRRIAEILAPFGITDQWVYAKDAD